MPYEFEQNTMQGLKFKKRMQLRREQICILFVLQIV